MPIYTAVILCLTTWLYATNNCEFGSKLAATYTMQLVVSMGCDAGALVYTVVEPMQGFLIIYHTVGFIYSCVGLTVIDWAGWKLTTGKEKIIVLVVLHRLASLMLACM